MSLLGADVSIDLLNVFLTKWAYKTMWEHTMQYVSFPLCEMQTPQASQNPQLYESPWPPQSSPLPQGDECTVLASSKTWSAWRWFPAPIALPLHLSFSKYQQNLKTELAVKKSCILAKKSTFNHSL